MSDKVFITAKTLLEDSFRLAAQVYDSGFRPQFIVGIWRGGAPIGIAVQEYFDYKKVETDHIAVRTSSYYGIGKQSKTIKVHGLHYIIENANADDGLLIVDDVFDSGRSVVALKEKLSELDIENLNFKTYYNEHKKESHQKCRNYFQDRAVEVGKTGVMGRHTTNRHRAESMADGIEKCHASKPVGQCTKNGNTKIK